MPKPQICELDLYFIREAPSGLAILVSDGENEVWLPKSAIEYECDGEGAVNVSLPISLAQDKELI